LRLPPPFSPYDRRDVYGVIERQPEIHPLMPVSAMPRT
jgi:hypothetical protein